MLVLILALFALVLAPMGEARAAVRELPRAASLLDGRRLVSPVPVLGPTHLANVRKPAFGGGDGVASGAARVVGWAGVGAGVAGAAVGVALFQGALGEEANPLLGGGILGAGVMLGLAGLVMLNGAACAGCAAGKVAEIRPLHSPLPAREAIAGGERSRAFDRGTNVPMPAVKW